MIFGRLSGGLRPVLLTAELGLCKIWRAKGGRQVSTHFRSGALKPKPDERPFGILSVIAAVMPGLFIGAMISKNVANFLEENELFVPSDDDDDDD